MAYTRAITNISPYWDDYTSYRNFLRVIFNPSRAVQARELTQMQTAGQNQLAQVAGHLFKDGSPIVGAKVEVTINAPFVEIAIGDVYEQDAAPTVNIGANVQDLVGTRIQAWTSDSNVTSGTLAKVLLVDNNAGTLRMQLDYHGGEFTTSDPGYKWATKYYTDVEVATAGQKYQSHNVHTSAIGTGMRAKVDIGTVWLNGFFVEIPVEQEIFVTKTGVTGTFVIGYEFEEVTLTTLTAGELDPIDGVTDLATTIQDPAGSSNNGAPGADRYMVKVNLVSWDITDIASGTYDIIKNDGTVIAGTAGNPPKIPTNFHQLIKMTNGAVEEKVEKTQYADILDLLAERTYDESGSYTIEPFSLTANVLDADNFNYEVGPGRAYIFGYERENISPFEISASKTRTFRQVAPGDPLGTIAAQYGTYGVIRQGPSIKTFTTITSDAISDQPDHGYGLGDRITYADGTGSVTGLTDATDYYAVPVDKDNFKLASTPTNATAGTTLTISTSGSDHTLTAAGNQGFGAFDPTEIEEGYLMTGFSGCGTSIGNPVRVLFYRNTNGRLRVYLANSTDLLTDLQEAKSICSVNTGNPNPAVDTYLNIDPFDVVQTLGYNQPIVQLPAKFIKEVTTLNYPSLIKLAGVSVTADPVKFNLATVEGGDTFQGGEESIAFLVNSSGNFIDPNTANIDVLGSIPTGTGTASMTSDTDHDLATGTYDFYMLIDRASATVRTKTLTSDPIAFTVLAGQGAPTVIFNGSDNSGMLTAATSTRFDVAVIESVIEDPNGTPIPLDITDFTLDGGQRDMLYDYASVTRISGDFEASKEYEVHIHYWAFSGTGDFFAVNSYAKTSTYYDTRGGLARNIPVYVNESGTKTWALRDCLDFRKSITEIATAKEIAEPSGSLTADYDYYLPRKDKVWIDRLGNLGVTEGVAEEFPRLPPDQSGTVTLFDVDLIPFLFDPVTGTRFDSDQINVKLIDHKNYTMDNIRALETRLRNLEAYSSEIQLELDSYADTVVDADGLPRSKNGIFVDNFTNHTKGSVWESAYRCSMDGQEGVLRSPYEMNHINFEYDSGAPVGGSQTNVSETANAWSNTITLDYSVVSYLEQPLASEYMNINPFAIVVWAGEIIMNPFSDTWVDTVFVPALQIQDPDEAARIRALYERTDTGIPNWGAWKTQIIGVESSIIETSEAAPRGLGGDFIDTIETIITTEQSTRTATILRQSGTEVVLVDMGERTIDVSRIPWMRTIDIVFEAFGMRPDTLVIPYFATVDVAANVIWDGGNPSGLTTKAGYVKGTFTVPSQTFMTGKNIFTLKEQVTNPTTIASIEFRAEGTLYTKQQEILSVEVPVYSTRTITERELNVTETSSVIATRWVEPIAQTFLIEDDGGVFLESVDIFFATKDRYLPVTLWVVETIAGVPGQKRVPFGMVTVNAGDITATDWDDQLEDFRYNGDHYEVDGETPVAGKADNDVVAGSLSDFVATKFSFSDAVYLKQGVEYAFVLMSNSNNYNAYISRMGGYNIIDGIAIDKQPHMGSLLKSQNTSTWTPDQYADIKFELHRCEFDVSASALYLRTKGETSYWDDIVYAPGDQIVFNHTGDGLNVYQNIIATGLGAGHDPEAFPLRWVLVGEGFYDATLLNVSTDDLIIPGTSLVRQYLSAPDTTWINFTNKEDISIESKDQIELYIDGESQNPSEPKGIDLKLQLASESSWHSPVINKNRSFCVPINNLVLGSGPYDAGVYISEATLLKENAASLKVLIDVALPDSQASINPEYRIVKENLRFVDHDALAGKNLFSENIGTRDNLGYVYHMDSDFATVSALTEKETVIIDGLDSTNDRVYLSSIANPANFVDKSTLPGTGSIFITIDPGILFSGSAGTGVLDIYTGTSTTAGDYVFDPDDRNLYLALVDTTAPPTPAALDWTLIPCVFVDLAVQIDADVEWRPMQQVGTVKSFVNTTRFVEYEYEPVVSPSEEFDNFAIRINMISGDEINVPRCKRLRVIAVN